MAAAIASISAAATISTWPRAWTCASPESPRSRAATSTGSISVAFIPLAARRLSPVPTRSPVQNYATASPPTRDINPFAAASTLLSYDNRFICGKYCNYATYDMPADGNFRSSTGDGRVKFRGWGVSGQVDWDITDGYKLTS